MEYYGLRKSGEDIDIVVTKFDLFELIKRYPKNVKDLFGDLGVAVKGFEIWKTIRYLDYDFLAFESVEKADFRVISVERLLYMKALAMHIPKNLHDAELLVEYITSAQSAKAESIARENKLLIGEIGSISYLERLVATSANADSTQ